MTKRALLIILTVLAITAGCSISASLHGQELNPIIPSSVFDVVDPPARPVSAFAKFQNLKRSLMAIVRVRHKNSSGTVDWYGSAIVIRKLDGNLYLLSNQHVCGYPKDSGRIEAEFMDETGHKSLGYFKVDVLQAIQKGNIDAAICRLPHGTTLNHIPQLPLGSDLPAPNDLIVQCGADAGHAVNQSLGYVLKREGGLIWYLPSSYGGDSGSAIVSEDGLRTIGLVAWQTILPPVDGTVGLAQSVPAVVGAFKKGTFMKLPNNVFSVADQRWRFRRKPNRPTSPLVPITPPIEPEELDDIFGLDGPTAPQPSDDNETPEVTPEDPQGPEMEEETLSGGPLRKLLDRLQRNQEDLKQGQKDERGVIGGLIGKMNLIETALTWIWRVVIAVVILGCIGLFAQQGWLLRIVVTFVKLVIRLTKAAIAVVKDAITKPLPPKDASVEDQLASIREELTEELNHEGETP